ncbi:peptidoglycan bridge formation glycyltransferase FemA/FemB family protein [Ligilactobacillus sp. LYQ60]|uniref:peptidoglycan bridge formation glycyltransferase FemA/FemB family protein n=1 Tax=unclassified Ligilactobacillus TaxID=2767920 RepID=UPI003854560B
MKFVENLDFNKFEKFEMCHPQGRYMQSRGQLKMNEVSKQVGCIGVIDDDNKLIAGAFYFIDHARMGDIYSIWGGPLLDYSNDELVDFFFKSAESYFKKCGGVAFRLTPVLDFQKFDDDGRVVEKYNQHVLGHLTALGYRNVPQNPITDNRMPKVGMGYEYRKDLRGIKNSGELRSTYDKRARNDIRRAERFGVYIERVNYDGLGLFKKNTASTAENRSYQDQTLEFYQHAYQSFGDNVMFVEVKLNLVDFISKRENEIISLKTTISELEKRLVSANSKKLKSKYSQATKQLDRLKKAVDRAKEEKSRYGKIVTLSGGMFYIQPQELGYLFSFTNKQFSNYYGQHYLMDYMMRLAIKKHIPTYNFYMVTGLFDGSDGVLKFKQLFNGATYRTLGWFEKPLRPVRFYLDRVVKKLTGHIDDIR